MSDILTPIDSIPGFSGWLYAHQVLFFPASVHDSSSIVQNLKSGLTHTFEALPFLAGTVKHASHASQRGRLCVTLPSRTADQAVTFKDLTKTNYPDYETLRSKHFPISEVDYDVLMSLPKPGAEERPVMLVQINFVRGGIIMGIVYDHACIDGTGAVFVAKVWATYCRGEDGSKLVKPAVTDKSRLMDGSRTATFDDFPVYSYLPETQSSPKTVPKSSALSGIIGSLKAWTMTWCRSLSAIGLRRFGVAKESKPCTNASDLQPERPVVETFFFSRSKLDELKRMALKRDENKEVSEWISTNDALASLLWCCITNVYKTRVPAKRSEKITDPIANRKRVKWIDKMAVAGSPETEEPFTLLGFVINARKVLRPPLDPNHIGNVLIWNAIAAPFNTVTTTAESICSSAYSLRRRINVLDANYLDALIGLMASVPDISRVTLDPGPFVENLIVVNSWAGFQWYGIDWGKVVGGKCERVRFEQLDMPGFCLVLPEIGIDARCEGGAGLEVAVTLKAEDLQLLKDNELFMRFAEWRCR